MGQINGDIREVKDITQIENVYNFTYKKYLEVKYAL